MRTAVLLPLLAACGAESPVEGDAAPLAAALAAVPGTNGMTLTADGAGTPGNTVTFTITGAAPGERVYLALGTAEQVGALCPPVLGGGCVDLENARLIRTVDADGSGVATLTTTAPSLIVPGGSSVFQAVSASATSNTVLRFNRQLSGSITLAQSLVGQTSASAGGSRGIYGPDIQSDGTGFSICQAGYAVVDDPLTTVTPCAGCDFVFGSDTPGAPGVEWSDNGSACVDFLGADLAAYYGGLTYGLAVGLDYDYGTASLGIQYPGYTSWVLSYPASFGAAGRFEAVAYTVPYGTY